MHLDLLIRGKVEFVALWEAHVQAQYFKLRRWNIKTGEEAPVSVQLGLRRGVLGSYELVFPKEALPDVLAMLGLSTGNIGVEKTIFHKAQLSVIRKILGDRPIPKKAMIEANKLKDVQNIMINDRERALSDCITPGVSLHPVGIKYDKFGTVDGVYKHELL